MTRMANQRWKIFAVLACGYLLVYFHRLCPAVLAVDMMRDLETSAALLGLLGSAYFYPYALMQLPAGLLADSWGARRTISLFLLVAGVGSLLMALAPAVGWAVLGRTLVGLGVAMVFVPTMKVLTEWFRAREFAAMTGVLVAVGGVGSLVSTGPLAWLGSIIGWRFSFVAVAFLTLGLAGLVWRVVRDRPLDLGLPPLDDPLAPQVSPLTLAQGIRTVAGCGPFWVMAAWFFFDCAIFFAFGGLWGGPYLRHLYGLEGAAAGNLLSLLAIGMIVGSPVLTLLSSRLLRGRKPVLILCSCVTVGLTALLAFATTALPLWGVGTICFGLGLFTSSAVIIGFAATRELFPASIAGTAIGLVNLFPFAGGALFQPLLGLVLERHEQLGVFSAEGYRQAFLLLFGCALAALCASFLMRETLTRSPVSPDELGAALGRGPSEDRCA